MSSRLTLIVYSVSGKETRFEELDSLNVRLADGSLLGIRPDHDRLIAMTGGTDFVCTRSGAEFRVDVAAGMLTVEKNTVKVFTTL